MSKKVIIIIVVIIILLVSGFLFYKYKSKKTPAELEKEAMLLRAELAGKKYNSFMGQRSGAV